MLGRLSIIAIQVAIAILVLFSYVPGVWLADLAGQFRLVYLAILVVCLPCSICCRSLKTTVSGLVLLIMSALPVAALYIPQKSSSTKGGQSLKFLNYNTEFQHNENFADFIDLIHSYDPDIITIVEVDQKWINALSDTMRSYKFRTIVIEGPGMGVFSKFPMTKTNVQRFGKSHHPRISTTFLVADRKVSCIVIHPTTPKYATTFAERNEELQAVAAEISNMTGPRMLIGDFNCGPWSYEFGRLLNAGLLDSEKGFGPQPTWPARTGRVLAGVPIPPLVPIDHLLFSQEFHVLERKVGPALGSDHLPVFVRAAF